VAVIPRSLVDANSAVSLAGPGVKAGSRVVPGDGGVKVPVGGASVGVSVQVGKGVIEGSGKEVGGRVRLGIGVQVGGGAFQIDVGEGPGVRVGSGVQVGVGE
jgi:hypothetical protein